MGKVSRHQRRHQIAHPDRPTGQYPGLLVHHGWKALLLTSALFVLVHLGQYGFIQFVFLFAFSMLLGLAREHSGSLLIPIILHSVNNMLPALVVIYLGLA